MKKNRFVYADLDDAGVEKVRVLEEQMGSLVVVMERVLPAAKLSEGQLEQIRSLEQDLGVVLVAYQP